MSRQSNSHSTPQPQDRVNAAAEMLKAFLLTPPRDRAPDYMQTLNGITLDQLTEVARALKNEIPREDTVRQNILRNNITLALMALNRAPMLRDRLNIRPVFARLSGPQGLWTFGVRQRTRPRPRR
ncbi:small capsid protein [Gallid alphaherpesvirus 1]|uniref:Small capsid protein n=1 Tax=Infectious laryngotracheitis virus TaxID=10386 RepID=Q9QH57_ILTV|nr:small capsid protein [Gallid alphaherpesvirus 1]YP_182364.1 small capsid protein [Gallid alphaherpesvirus 1]AAD56207.1 UL35 homolog [Gallid alphaherpesvirus 1]AEB97327.1 small capsid protein [Gallid alphaherpesvirus 1]AER28060.1 small capsid protein [Gallid alphaherpesvirus 1]AER28139.1 small capsid protein [Gallid alphaherpesvirus 1]AEW67779.1 small capsid protein [Gallid alphaherpesvirus 1]